MIRAGKLDQVIAIQALTVTQDGMGASVEAWATVSVAPTRAAYIPLRGLESLEAGKLESSTLFKLRIRRYSSMDTKHRVIHNGKTYRITGIEDYHRDGDMVLHCAEVV